MRVFMAGGINGNLKPFWKTVSEKMRCGYSFDDAKEVAMRVFLADSGSLREAYCEEPTIKYRPYILESFYYADKETERLLPYFGDFLLDSGAFTFMGGFSFKDTANGIDFHEYTERYADFIVRNKIDKFFELDVDVCVGYEEVKRLRRLLEKKTGKPCIPVWHSTRGKDEFLRMCDEYDYVALGGIVGGEWNTRAEQYIPWFISEAHKRGAKIHGLGYTKIDKLKKYHFDSVDSTAWTTGNRFGFVYQFKNGQMLKYNVPAGKRIKEARQVAVINYTEWIKFQRYAETHL